MSKIKNGGLDQYGAGPFEQQQFGTAGGERVKPYSTQLNFIWCIICDDDALKMLSGLWHICIVAELAVTTITSVCETRYVPR